MRKPDSKPDQGERFAAILITNKEKTMNKANFEFNVNQVNPWGSLSAGAKVATVLAGLAIAAASVAASLFLAGAALFAGAVFVTYRWVSGLFTRKESVDGRVATEYPEVTTSPSAN